MGDFGGGAGGEDGGQTGSPAASTLQFSVTYRGQAKSIHLDRFSTLEGLYEAIAQSFDVLPVHQKIITPVVKLKQALADEKNVTTTLDSLGFTPELEKRSGAIKLMLVGPRQEELEAVRKEEEQGIKMQAPRRYHPSMLRGGTTPRRTGPGSSSSASNPFHSLKVHPATPESSQEYAQVMDRLRKLSTDEAVIHVCHIHGFQVGQLTELLPHEHPNLLGLNENMGQRISVRVRTDRYDGLRAYRDTRQVLLHELAHNKVNDHPPEFKMLNSELNAQVEAFERAKREGTHSLLGDGDVYEPSAVALPSEPTSHVLGGGDSSLGSGTDSQTRRERILQATMKRLEKAEAEIERGCGSAL